jgi:hypothetical protein
MRVKVSCENSSSVFLLSPLLLLVHYYSFCGCAYHDRCEDNCKDQEEGRQEVGTDADSGAGAERHFAQLDHSACVV